MIAAVFISGEYLEMSLVFRLLSLHTCWDSISFSRFIRINWSGLLELSLDFL